MNSDSHSSEQKAQKASTSRAPGLENKVALALILSLTPASCIIILLLVFGNYSTLFIITIIPLSLLSVLAGAVYIRSLLTRQFFGVANVIECLRNGDFTMRANVNDKESAWGEVNFELNKLAVSLHHKRIDAVESEIILDKLIEEFDVPFLVTERGGALRHINAAGIELFGIERREVLGLSVEQLNLNALLLADTGSIVEHQFPNRSGRWEVRRNIIRQHGTRFNLLLLNDLSRTLREEERQAWQKLIRVLGHELNNSLASITSVAETMSTNALINSDPKLSKGLGVIVERGHGLLRFTEAYTSLAKLPKPQKQAFQIATLLERITTLFSDQVVFDSFPDFVMEIDPDQIEQLLLNIIKNALETSSEPLVRIDCRQRNHGLLIEVTDNGQGITNPENLFVPFYTTKAQGSGIGLYLSRQIAEAHNGTLTLANRADGQGCVASIWLPFI